VRDHHRRAAGGGSLASLLASEPGGRAYLADLAWALAYADANRRALLAAVAAVLQEALGAEMEPHTLMTCHHNHVRQETHGGLPRWVHRKGAISASHGELGVIPGSMGSASYHVEGRGHAPALCSASHGAGRRMSRSEARRRISGRTLAAQLGGVFWDHRRTEELRDEAPGAYKDIGRVMRAQRALVRIVRRLEPVLAFKGA
jgi:tRNA-splicing ligase RtcB